MEKLTPDHSHQKYVEHRFDNITKSRSDRRGYRGIILTNKMKILLISDPTTDKSAASINVQVGKYNHYIVF